MHFTIVAEDYKDAEAPERRKASQPEHKANAEKLMAEGHSLYGVALLSEEGEPIGSVYICDFPDREAVDDYLANEPYIRNKVWEKVNVWPCRVGPLFLEKR